MAEPGLWLTLTTLVVLAALTYAAVRLLPAVLESEATADEEAGDREVATEGRPE